MRINSQEQLEALVADITTKVTMETEEEVNKFLEARMTKYNKETRTDSYLKSKAGKTYLPYPYNVKLVAMLHESTAEVEDDYDF